jgi:hypothetical protein
MFYFDHRLDFMGAGPIVNIFQVSSTDRVNVSSCVSAAFCFHLFHRFETRFYVISIDSQIGII